MADKNKDSFRVWTGFKFGIGIYLAWVFMQTAENMAMLIFTVIMKGLGFMPGVM